MRGLTAALDRMEFIVNDMSEVNVDADLVRVGGAGRRCGHPFSNSLHIECPGVT